jgi:two-component system, NtrC family, sensor kinase
MTSPEAAAALRGRAPKGAGLAAARLRAGRQTIGVVSARLAAPVSPAQRRLLGDVATLLAPFVVQVERARRLEATIADRTREVDEQRDFLERIVDNLPVGLYVIDRDYRVRAWNSKRESGLQGVKRARVLGRTVFDVLHRQPSEMLRKEFDELFRTGQLQQFQTESDATGERRVYRLSKIPMRVGGGGEVTHAITIGEDITDWKLAEERIAQAEKLAALGTLAAGVMHEINNPLATIAAAAEALETRVREKTLTGDGLSGELADTLRLISDEVHRSKGIVNGVLEFSRPARPHRERVAVNGLVERTLFLLSHHQRFKRLTIVNDFAPDLPRVNVNDEQLVQVLMALLINAMDAMKDEGTITLRTRSPELGWVAIEVEDQGEGIRRADLPRIFEPFFTTKPVGHGTGLGLSVCYSIVSDHGGRIDVTSVFGRGSTFRVLLPVQSRP